MPIKDRLSTRAIAAGSVDEMTGQRSVLAQIRAAWNRLTGAPPEVTADGGVLELDWTRARSYRLTLSSDIATVEFVSPGSDGDRGLYHLIIDQGGGHTIGSWPASVIWVGSAGYTVTATAGRTDLIAFYWDGERYIADARQNAS